jgi:hypothetical protein
MNAANVLCDDVLNYIYEFVPNDVKKSLNRSLFKEYSLEYPIKRLNSFFINIIRQDYSFVLECHLREKFKRWYKLRNWIYKNMVFHNYIEYLKYLCIVYESQKCRNMIRNIEEEIQPEAGKKYKKKRIRHTRWSN